MGSLAARASNVFAALATTPGGRVTLRTMDLPDLDLGKRGIIALPMHCRSGVAARGYVPISARRVSLSTSAWTSKNSTSGCTP